MTIAEVSVRAFDCHLTLDPLLRAGDLRPAFAWLGDADAYRRRLFADAERQGGLRVEPWSDLHRHPFWGRFRRAVEAAAQTGPMLMPVRIRPVGAPVRLESAVLARQPVLRQSAWLWPFGWSSEVRLKARQALRLDDLAPLLGEMSRDLQTLGPVPARLSLSRLFKTMSEQLLDALWEDGRQPLASLKLDRFLTITVRTDPQREVLRFARRPPGARQWSDADRAEFYALAANATVTPRTLSERKTRTTFVDLEAGSFVLLDLTARRMIVFLTVSRRAPGTWLDCLENNIVDFLRQGLVLHHAAAALAKAATNPLAVELAATARRSLSEFADSYASPFSRKLVEVQRWDRPD